MITNELLEIGIKKLVSTHFIWNIIYMLAITYVITVQMCGSYNGQI
jgi:hypothetical protein